jgi:hypothetical protein
LNTESGHSCGFTVPAAFMSPARAIRRPLCAFFRAAASETASTRNLSRSRRQGFGADPNTEGVEALCKKPLKGYCDPASVTQRNGRLIGDFTVTRLSPERFFIVDYGAMQRILCAGSKSIYPPTVPCKIET